MQFDPKPYKPSHRRGAVLFLLTLIFVPYLVWSRAWSDILLYTLACSFPLALRLAAREVSIYFEKEDKQLRVGELAKVLIPTLFFVVFWTVPLLPVVATLYGAIAFCIDVTGWIVSRLVDREVSVGVGVVATGVVGGALFYFRLRYRSLYGCSEVIVGLLVAGQRLNDEVASKLNAPVLMALLTAGAYLVVRGLDNVHQGVKSDPIAASFVDAVDKRAGRKLSKAE
jgi:hypothetical protein